MDVYFVGFERVSIGWRNNNSKQICKLKQKNGFTDVRHCSTKQEQAK